MVNQYNIDWRCNPKSHAASMAPNQSLLNQYNKKNKN